MSVMKAVGLEFPSGGYWSAQELWAGGQRAGEPGPDLQALHSTPERVPFP